MSFLKSKHSLKKNVSIEFLDLGDKEMPVVKSAKGVLIDFDLLKVQQSLMSAQPSDVVIKRKESIEDRVAERRERWIKARQQRNAQVAAEEQDMKTEQVEEVVAAKPRRQRVLQQVDIEQEAKDNE